MEKKHFEDELEKSLTSHGLLRYTRDYFKAFEDIHEKYPNVIIMYEVKYYLLSHSIELGMKAILREKGYTRKKLINIGHDLEKLINVLHENGILIDVASMKRTFILNDYYRTKQFEYPQTGYKELPSLDDMKESAHLLLKMARKLITKELPK